MNTLVEYNGNNKLGNLLRELRSSKGYSLRELNDLTGISFSYLSKFELGKNIPSKEDLVKISDALNGNKSLLFLLAGYIPDEISNRVTNNVNLDYDIKGMSDAVSKVIRKYKKSSTEKINYSDYNKFITTNYDDYLKNIYSFYLNIFKEESLMTYATKYIKELGLDEELKEKLYKILVKNDFELLEREDKFKFIELINELAIKGKTEHRFTLESQSVVKEEYHTEYHVRHSKSLSMFTDMKTSALSQKDELLQSGKEKLKKILDQFKNMGNTTSSTQEDTIDFVQIPIYGEIKAGYDMLGEQNVIGYEITSKSSISDGEYFYLKVKGDSMVDDGIIDGCKVLVKKQGHVENGKIGVVIVNGEEATLKRVFYDGDKIILQASNRSIPPRTFELNDVLIQGQVRSYVVDL